MIHSDFAGGDGTYHLKVLVPGVAAGAIIGKGGDTIAQLQKDTGARVKMSKSHDFYPGMYPLYLATCLRINTAYTNNVSESHFAHLQQELPKEYA